MSADETTYEALQVNPNGKKKLIVLRDSNLAEDLGDVIGGLLGVAACGDPVNHYYFRDVTDPEEADTDPGRPNRVASELAGTLDTLRGTIVFLGGPASGPDTRDVDLAALGVELDG